MKSMTPRRVTITIQSNLGEDGPLAVRDSLCQILDFFDLLGMIGKSSDQESVAWNLVSISKSSPLSAVAEPVAAVPGFAVDVVADRATELVASAITELSAGKHAPDWMMPEARSKARNIFNRNLNGLGRTDITFDDERPSININERVARASLNALERTDLDEDAAEQDSSHSETGSIDGHVTETTTYHGRQAIKMRDRATGADVTCVFTEALAAEVGSEHSWSEVWEGRQVLVSGEIFYRRDGRISRIYATGLQNIEPKEINIRDVADPAFTDGLTPNEHLKKLWGGDIG